MKSAPATATPAARPSLVSRLTGWLRGARGGLFALAVVVGVGSGLGAVVFRELISAFTWLATGHQQFGQQGYLGSSHLPWLGLGFFVLIPVAGGFLYGPMIYRWAREARGHGVPEVMIAVAENGGRIRPQVSVIKAVASALCIGVGGSVGREGPIVQIGSALASTLGQWLQMPENRLRILVACGAGGGISATFNAPITGVFFGVEIILREFSIDALFTVMLSAMLADVVARPILGSQPFLHGFPPGIVLHNPRNYLLVALLAVLAGVIGVAFKNVVYKVEDIWDHLWKGRPEWARPGLGGIVLGLLLLALPQMYGVGYPVMYKAVGGSYALWFLVLLAAGKMLATSLSLGIGGSGGIFAPSLFIGVTSGMAFGDIVHHLFGPSVGQPALYAVVAMGAVFTSAARAPLTSLASVVEMTGDFTLTLPVMLAVAIASTISRALSYGTIYTTKLLRRGNDIDRAAPWRVLQDLKVTEASYHLQAPLIMPGEPAADSGPASPGSVPLPGRITNRREPQVVFASESLSEALRQLSVYDRDGLPVLSDDGLHIEGWITNASVLSAVARQIYAIADQPAQPSSAEGGTISGPDAPSPAPPTPLHGYQIVEVTIGDGSPAIGQTLGSITWPSGWAPVSVFKQRKLRVPGPGMKVGPGDRINLLAPTVDGKQPGHQPGHPGGQPGTLQADGQRLETPEPEAGCATPGSDEPPRRPQGPPQGE